MDERRRHPVGEASDDADARGEHRYPDEVPPPRRDGTDQAEAALTREPGQYVAGADGTQQIAAPRDPGAK